MAEYYSKNLARETQKGLMENAMMCKHTGGKPPLGYDVDPETKRLVINPREAAAVYKGVYVFNKSKAKDVDGKRNGHAYKNGDEIIRIDDGVPAIIKPEDFDRVQ